MSPLDEKPFRSEKESAQEPAEVHIRMGHPRVRPHVIPALSKSGELTKRDFVTSFLVAWEPSPTPPAHWIELLRAAPFGTHAVRANAEFGRREHTPAEEALAEAQKRAETLENRLRHDVPSGSGH